MCIHAAAYCFCIMWFEIEFQINLNLHSKLGWKIGKGNRKGISLLSFGFWPRRPTLPIGPTARSAFPSLPRMG